MISYEAVPMAGAFSGKIKGYAYLTFWNGAPSERAPGFDGPSCGWAT